MSSAWRHLRGIDTPSGKGRRSAAGFSDAHSAQSGCIQPTVTLRPRVCLPVELVVSFRAQHESAAEPPFVRIGAGCKAVDEESPFGSLSFALFETSKFAGVETAGFKATAI